jgi:hypothetical protein
VSDNTNKSTRLVDDEADGKVSLFGSVATAPYSVAIGEPECESRSGHKYWNQNDGKSSVLLGGVGNKVLETASRSGLIGGALNALSGEYSCIVGGSNNIVGQGESIFLGAGERNKAECDHSVVIGGKRNSVAAEKAVVIGGSDNQATGECAVIFGGENNKTDVSVSSLISSKNSEIKLYKGGSPATEAQLHDYTSGSVVLGGNSNTICVDPSLSTGFNSAIVGCNNTDVSLSNSVSIGGAGHPDFISEGDGKNISVISIGASCDLSSNDQYVMDSIEIDPDTRRSSFVVKVDSEKGEAGKVYLAGVGGWDGSKSDFNDVVDLATYANQLETKVDQLETRIVVLEQKLQELCNTAPEGLPEGTLEGLPEGTPEGLPEGDSGEKLLDSASEAPKLLEASSDDSLSTNDSER